MTFDKLVKPTILATAVFVVLSAIVVTLLGTGVMPVQANDQSADAPSIAISLTPSDTVRQGTEIAVNLTMGGLERNLDWSTLRFNRPVVYKYRADIVDHDSCESSGWAGSINLVDEETERRWATVSPDCPVGNYTINATLSDSLDNELATASATFSIVEPSLPIGSELSRSLGFVGNPCTEEGTASFKEAFGIDFVNDHCREVGSPESDGYIKYHHSSRYAPVVAPGGGGTPQAPTLSGAVSGNSITLAWSYWFARETSRYGAGGKADSYIIEKTWTDADGQTSSTEIPVPYTDRLAEYDYDFYTDTSVLEGVPYEYTITSVNESIKGETSPSVTVTLPAGSGSSTAPTSAPSAPTNLDASVTDEGIALSWNAPDDSVFGYEIRWRIPELALGGMGTYIDFTHKTSFVDPRVNLAAPYRYEYVVSAININGVGESSDKVAVSPASTCATDYSNMPAPTSRPDAPGNLTATQERNGIALRWDAPADPTVSSYLILRRSLTLPRRWDYLDIVGRTFCKTDTSYIDLTAADEAHYRYRVRATNDFEQGGLSWWSNAADLVTNPRTNTPASGPPTISGTVQVGQTLAASTMDITDPDGLTTSYGFHQWIANDGTSDSDIAGATASTYTLVARDVGKTIKVKVSFTDDRGNEETLISDATETILPRAFWEGALTVGEYTSAGTTWLGHSVFAAGFGAISLPRSVKVGQHFYTVQLIAHTATDLSLGISREVPEDFILQIGDMTFDSDDASRPQSTSSNMYSWQNATLDWSAGDDVSVALLSEAMAAARPANTEATGAPSISGSPTVGQTLTAATTGILDSNGMNYAAFRYQWLSNDGTNDSEITDATGSTYTLVDADEGKHIKVRVSFTDLAQHKESVISTAVGPISPESPAPIVLSATVDGATLTLTFSEGLTETPLPAVSTFKVYRTFVPNINVDTGVDSVAISGSTVTLTLAHAATSANDTWLVSYTVPSDPAAARLKDLSDNPAESFTGHAVTNNTAVAPPPLTASIHDEPSSHDGQSEFTFELQFSEEPKEDFSYKTLRDHAFTVTRGTVKGGKVDGARRLVSGSNIEWLIKIRPTSNGDVTIVLPITEDCDAQGAICTDDGTMLSSPLEFTVSGPTSQQTSQQRQENTAATGSPTISGTVQVGQTLAASTTGIADTDGLTNASYSYQWIANDGTSDSDIADATASTYTLVAGDAGKMIKARVTFTDDGGNEEILTSAATAAVAAAVPGDPGSLSVSVNDTGKLDVSWDAPDSNGGSAVTGYEVQWKESSDRWDTPAEVSETTVTGTSHTATGLTDGVEYTFRVFAVNSAGDGSASEEESGTPRETTAPTVSSATVDGATLILTFSEGLTETPLPAVTTFTVNVGDNQREVNSVAISGSTVTLTLSYVATSTDAVSVGYTVPSDAAAARLKDLSDNPAESFTGQAVTNNTAAAPPLLTASIHDEPSSHDGQSEFTFELQFSEEPKSGFSYKTLRDHAFTVTRGTVKGDKVDGARRLVSGSNIGWLIKIRPTSNGDVTIVLPITEDCDAQGAICTGDGTMLSSPLEFTVSGPTSQQTSQQRQENTAATGSPTISGTVQVGQTLAAATTGITDPDGTTNASYSYQWTANDGTSDSDIANATSSTYTLVAVDAGKTIKVKVTFTDDAGNEETLTSVATAAVAAAVPGDPGILSVSVNDTGKLDLSWDAPESNGGSAVTGYRVQWKEAADSWDTPADVSETTVTGTSHTVTGLTDGVEYTFRVFAVNTVGDSSASDDASGTPRETTAPPPTGPDLRVYAILIANTRLSAGVGNYGDVSSAATTLRFYRSTDATITTSDTEVGTDAIGALSAGGRTSSAAIDFTRPSTPGTYYYGACVDTVSGESDTTNNCSGSLSRTVSATTTPDLAVGTPTVSDSTPSAGGSFTLSATVSNRGDGSSGATTLRYYRSTDSTITTSDTSVGTDAVGTLSASGTSAETIDLTAPSEPGTYYYGACVDAVSDESDTTNNCSGSVSITVSAATAPDLAVGTPTVSDSTPSAGGSLTLSATVRNQGDGSSGATTLRYYRSTDSTITTSDTSVGTDAVGTLAASGTSAETIDLTTPSGPGTYYYGACVDAVSSESDTTNNCSGSVQVTVSAAPPPTGPDLRVYAILIANTSLGAGVGNYGDVSSAATTLRVYRSTDATITTSDTEVGTDAIGALSAGGRTSSAAIDFTRPSTPGTYYYGACVDTVSGESDTTNNCSGSLSRTVSDG